MIVYVLIVWWAGSSASAAPQVFTHASDCTQALEQIVAHSNDKPSVADCYVTVVQ